MCGGTPVRHEMSPCGVVNPKRTPKERLSNDLSWVFQDLFVVIGPLCHRKLIRATQFSVDTLDGIFQATAKMIPCD
jgi:hypothetical protein